MVLQKLAWSNLVTRKARAALTVAAIALAVSLVVSVTSGYASVEAAVFQYLNRYIGTTDVEVTRAGDNSPGFSAELLEQVRADPDVLKVDGRYETYGTLHQGKGDVTRVGLIGLRRPDDRGSDDLSMEKGGWFNVSRGNVCVIDQVVAEALKVDIGGEVTANDANASLTLKVVGIVHKPAMLAQFMKTVYLPLDTLQEFVHKERTLSRMDIDLRAQANQEAWLAKWDPVLKKADPTLRIRLARDTQIQMSKNLEGIHLLSYMGGTVSMLAATFIVLSALSMGVTERQRTLAMLRAVGAFKSQIAMLVVIEGILLAACGAAIGVPLGWLWVRALAWMYSDVFAAGVVVSWGGVLFGTVGSVLAALVASALPAWIATRVDPLEAMSPQAARVNAGPPWRTAAAGLALICIDPFLFFGPMEPLARLFGAADPKTRAHAIAFVAHFVVGLPTLMAGFFLLAPMFVWLTEKVAGPIIAALLGLRYALLRQQLTTGIWRAAGTAAALMVGLAVLVVMQTNGNTMLRGWRLPDRFPDVFVFAGITSGLTWEEQAQLATVPGIRAGEVMPIGVAMPRYGSKWYQLAMGITLAPDATMYIAIDPNKAFKMMELEFRQGGPDQASKLLDEGVRVTRADGQNLSGSLTGPLSIIMSDGQPRQVEAKLLRSVEPLAGATSQPATNAGGAVKVLLRDGTVLQGRLSDFELEPLRKKVDSSKSEPIRISAESVSRMETGQFLVVTEEFNKLKNLGVGDVLPLETGQGTKNFTIVGVVWSPGIDVMVTMFDMGRQFDQRTAYSVFGSLDDGRRFFGISEVHLFAANLDPWYPKEDLLKNVKAKLGERGMTVGDVREIKSNIQQGFGRILLLVSTVAFAAMAVAALGVTNTIMASVRSRRWQFGILRSIGVTRGQLLRMVLGEAILLGLVGVAMGLFAGSVMTLDSNKLSSTVTGYAPPIAVPWGMIAAGAAIIMGSSLLASLTPALAVAKTEPLSLLQAGRAAA